MLFDLFNNVSSKREAVFKELLTASPNYCLRPNWHRPIYIMANSTETARLESSRTLAPIWTSFTGRETKAMDVTMNISSRYIGHFSSRHAIVPKKYPTIISCLLVTHVASIAQQHIWCSNNKVYQSCNNRAHSALHKWARWRSALHNSACSATHSISIQSTVCDQMQKCQRCRNMHKSVTLMIEYISCK